MTALTIRTAIPLTARERSALERELGVCLLSREAADAWADAIVRERLAEVAAKYDRPLLRRLPTP